MPGMMPPIVVNTPSAGSSNLKVARNIGLLVLAIYGIKKGKEYLDKVKAANDLKTDQQSTLKSSPKKPLYDLNGKPVLSANISTIAADIHEALSFPADEQRAIRVFKSTPYGHVADLETFYLNRYGDNLKQKFIDKLSDEEWISIKFNFR